MDAQVFCLANITLQREYAGFHALEIYFEISSQNKMVRKDIKGSSHLFSQGLTVLKEIFHGKKNWDNPILWLEKETRENSSTHGKEKSALNLK